nr:hypothetical protein [Tanacetum cinerariifolium]
MKGSVLIVVTIYVSKEFKGSQGQQRCTWMVAEISTADGGCFRVNFIMSTKQQPGHHRCTWMVAEVATDDGGRDVKEVEKRRMAGKSGLTATVLIQTGKEAVTVGALGF